MLRKYTALLLALALMMGLSGGLAQEQAPVNQDIAALPDSWLQSAVLFQGSVLLSGDGIYQAVSGQPELKVLQSFNDRAWQAKYPMSYSLQLVAGPDALYALNTSDGRLHTVTLGEEGASLDDGVEVDLKPLTDTSMGDDGYVMPPAQMLVHDNRLYVISVTYGMQGPEAKLVSYDLKVGGAATLSAAQHVQQLTPYKDGTLLALTADAFGGFNPVTGKNVGPQLMVWNPADDSMTELAAIDLPWRYEGAGLAYDAQNDYIYISMGTEVHRMDAQGNMVVCAYLTPTNRGGEFSGRLFLLPDGRLAAINGEGVSLRSADPKDLPAERLTIYGSYMDDTHKRAMERMAGTAVSFLDGKYFGNAQELGQALVGGEDNIDIFMLRTDQLDLQSLMAKGYIADLSGSAKVNAYTGGLYPMMAEAGTYQGKVLLVPVNMDASLYSYYPLIADQVGVEMPTTFDELCDLLEKWNDELGEQHPDILPMHAPDYNAQLIMMAIQLYAAEASATGKPFSFSDPQLRQMLQRATGVRTEDIAEKVDWGTPNANMDDIYKKVPMMESWYGLNLDALNELFSKRQGQYFASYGGSGEHEVGMSRPFQLSIAEGTPPRLPLTLTLAGVNARSKNLESAVKYLENHIQAIDPKMQAMLTPSLNDPIPNPNADRYNKWMDENEQSLKEEVEKAEGAQKTELQEQLARTLKENEETREENRWSVRREAIDMYRGLMENGFVSGWSDLNMIVSNADMQKLMTRFAQGQLPLDQFLQEAEGKLRLMRLENP